MAVNRRWTVSIHKDSNNILWVCVNFQQCQRAWSERESTYSYSSENVLFGERTREYGADFTLLSFWVCCVLFWISLWSFSCNQFKIHKKAKQTLKSETKKPDLNNEKLGLTSTEPLKKPLKLERQDRIKKGIRGRMWPRRGNSFDACDLSLVNQQSERTETLMRGFNTGIGTAAADADVIWQLNQLQEHLLGLFGALMGRKLQSHSDLESYLRGVKMLNSYRHDSRIWGK